MVVITQAEKVLCEEIEVFSKKYREIVTAYLEGAAIAGREMQAKNLRALSTMESLMKALQISLYIEENKLILRYQRPHNQVTIKKGDTGEEELNEKELCYILLTYKQEIVKYADKLIEQYRETDILRWMIKELDNIICKYVKA